MSGQELCQKCGADRAQWLKCSNFICPGGEVFGVLPKTSAIDHAAIRKAALREAAAIAQDYHEKALEWAKKVRGLERHIGETDSSRIATAILALIDKPAPDHSAAPGNMIDKGAG